MVIIHNMQAAYAGRQLNIIGKNKSLRSERLGSGYRINRASDDAAALSISEKMRGQIRGLLRASQNIEEGCNLIDTADGAMNEQVSILQRIRELTIQAYNDTYTQEDRLQIQKEVNACLKEIDRIAHETEYNTLKILQGNRKTVTKEIIEPEESGTHIEYEYISTKIITPSWLISKDNCNLSEKNSSVDNSNAGQDPDNEYIIINQNHAEDPDKDEEFWGPKDKMPAGFIENGGKYQREFTKTLKDNYKAVADFTKIAECTSKEELVKTMSELAGVAIAYECATCSERFQGLYFDTDDISVSLYTLEDLNKADGDAGEKTIRYQKDMQRVNLQKFLNDVGRLENEDSYNSASGKSYEDYIKENAQRIARGIVTDIVDNNKISDHFIRLTTDKTNDDYYKVVFYDFRDKGATEKKELTGNAYGNPYVRMSIKKEVPDTPVVIEHERYDGLWIQAGANTDQGIIIDLPDTTLSSLGLEDYNIFREGYCSAGRYGSYDPAIMNNAEYLGNHQYSAYVGGKVIERTETISETRIIQNIKGWNLQPGKPGGTDSNGEIIAAIPPKSTPIWGEPILEHYSYTRTITEMQGGHLATFIAYPPDSLLRVDKAIQKLTDYRTNLGAMKNRLEHAYLNDTNEAENLQSAESKMRDADFADEIVAYTRDSILQQAAQAMLANANSSRDGILALLNA